MPMHEEALLLDVDTATRSGRGYPTHRHQCQAIRHIVLVHLVQEGAIPLCQSHGMLVNPHP